MAVTPETTKLIHDWLEQCQAVGAADTVLRRRKYLRFGAEDDFVIKPAEAVVNHFSEMFVRGYNISPGGLGVLSKWLVHGDTPVLIHREQAPQDEPWVPATVVHCTQSCSGYKLGLSFES